MLQGVSACTVCPPLQFISTQQSRAVSTDAPVTSDLQDRCVCYCKTCAAHFKENVVHRFYIKVSLLQWQKKAPDGDVTHQSRRVVVIYTNSLAFISPTQSFPSLRASLWSSCVVLPLLALTWMSAVLAMTDKRSILFQILFAVFDSLQGFVIVMVHCILRREVQDDSTSSFVHLWSLLIWKYKCILVVWRNRRQY